jgi:hypothetical protein
MEYMFLTERKENLSYSIPEKWTSNVTFGGKNNDVLFITASKSVYTFPTSERDKIIFATHARINHSCMSGNFKIYLIGGILISNFHFHFLTLQLFILKFSQTAFTLFLETAT